MLSEPFNTPSPWRVEIPQRGPCVIKSPHGLYVGTGTTIDDARLMAAAPEMLAALEHAVSTMECALHRMLTDHSDCWICEAQTAIAKARGEASRV